MGYTFTIGEAVIKHSADDLRIKVGADGASHPDAPDHCPYTGNGSSRSPGYSAWADFCRDAGIFELFYGEGDKTARNQPCSENFHRETPFINDHPGCEPICKADLEYITAARIRWEAQNGGKPPGFLECSRDTNWQEIDNGKDPTLARLLWLEFWFGWALENCKIPVMENT